MKSKKHKKHHKQRNKHRNNGAGAASTAPPRSRPRLRVPRRGEAPPWKTIGAAVVGSVGSAVASGLLVNQQIVKPDTAALLMAATGGLGAYLTDGNARVAFTGVAAAGAGQYALVKIGGLADNQAQREAKAKAEAEAKAKADAEALAQQQAQLPPASSPPTRQHASGRGVVVDLFRDASADLELLDEDDEEDDDTPIEIDLDEAA
jgi:hypothetical protein